MPEERTPFKQLIHDVDRIAEAIDGIEKSKECGEKELSEMRSIVIELYKDAARIACTYTVGREGNE